MKIINKSRRLLAIGKIKLVPNENELTQEQEKLFKSDKNLQKYANGLKANNIIEVVAGKKTNNNKENTKPASKTKETIIPVSDDDDSLVVAGKTVKEHRELIDGESKVAYNKRMIALDSEIIAIKEINGEG